MADLSLERVQNFLTGLSEETTLTETIDPKQTDFTLGEVARLLGIKPASVSPLVRRHKLDATGKGKARTFPRATVAALLERKGRGTGVSTVGYYAREIKAFTRWLAKRKRIAEDPLTDLQGASL